MAKWIKTKCSGCDGNGHVAGYWGEVSDCPSCGCTGVEWISSGGRVAAYPGGPFRGMAEPGEYERLAKQQAGG